MTNNSGLVAISACSGLAGALLAQVIAAFNNYFTDKRKQYAELSASYRDKKIGIGEKFYFVNGEKMAIIKKNIRYWKNWNLSRSESSIEYLRKELSVLMDYTKTLDTENWQYNLAGIYFSLSFTNDEIIAANEKTHKLYLQVMDLADAINLSPEDNADLLAQYALAVFDLCSAYERIYARLQKDQEQVQQQLLREFAR